METAPVDPAALPQPPADPPAIDLPTLSQEALGILGAMLDLLAFKAQLVAKIESDCVRVQVECEDAGRLIGRKGSTVNEIQFLLNRILQRRHKTVPRIFLDVNGSQEKESPSAAAPPSSDSPEKLNEEMLTRVRALADQVRRWGESADLGSIAPMDRKAIQNLLAKDYELEAVSLEPNADPSKPQKMQMRLKQK